MRYISNEIKFKAKNQTAKFAVWVFVALVLVGGFTSLGYNWFKSGQVKSASIEETVPTFGEIPGWWYMENFGASVCGTSECNPKSDPDKDKLTNYQEFVYSSNPNNSDTNQNGLSDGEDVAFGYLPNKPGKVRFEDAMSDDSIVGESLAYNTEIKDLILDMADVSNLILPQVNESNLKISKTADLDSFVKYMTDLDAIAAKYNASPDQFANLGDQIKQNNPAAIASTKLLAQEMVSEYKEVTIPADAVELHKLQMSLWGLIPTVVEVPDTSSSVDALFDNDVNRWYDSAQAMITINQKVAIEIAKLRNKYLGTY